MKIVRTVLTLLLVAFVTLTPGETASAASTGKTYTESQMDQMVAPIALYPDNLLAQIMMASTYPLEIVEADRWVSANPRMDPKQREAALATKSWDPSVSSLTAFPDILSRMSQNLDWTKDLGEAFLASQQDVMAAIQRQRARAQSAGALGSTAQQTVTQQQGNIVIQPADPQIVYVPSYDPTVVYGSGWAPSTWAYPQVMVAPPAYVPGTLLAFGTGVVAGSLMFGGWNWANHCAFVSPNCWNYAGYRGAVQHNNININQVRNNQVNWQYNNYHRQNVNFNNTNLNARYNSTGISGVNRGNLSGYGQTAGGTRPTVSTPGTGPRGGTGGNNWTRPPNGVGTGQRPTTLPAGVTPNRSVPYTPPAGYRPNGSSPFGSSNSTFENRASARGAGSLNQSGGTFQNIPRNAPTRNFNTGTFNSGSVNRGSAAGGGRSFGGGRRR